MEQGLAYGDVLLSPIYTDSFSRRDVDTSVQLGPYTFDIPLIAAPMDTVCGVAMARKMYELGGLGILHRFCSIEDNVAMYKEAAKNNYLVGVSVGIAGDARIRTEALIDAGAKIVVIDVAHGHSKTTGIMIKDVKQLYPETFVIAGSVATHAGADYLSGCGADCIRVGVGGGGMCSTRIQTGCGIPQLTAIMECKRVKVPIIADGGIKTGGDLSKGLAAGATIGMIGTVLGGTTESPGKIITKEDGTKVKRLRGMASREAMLEFTGEIQDWKTAEGISTEVPFKGSAENVIKDLTGGLRSCLTYCGSKTISDLQSKAKFIKVSQAGYIEGTPHGK